MKLAEEYQKLLVSRKKSQIQTYEGFQMTQVKRCPLAMMKKIV